MMCELIEKSVFCRPFCGNHRWYDSNADVLSVNSMGDWGARLYVGPGEANYFFQQKRERPWRCVQVPGLWINLAVRWTRVTYNTTTSMYIIGTRTHTHILYTYTHIHIYLYTHTYTRIYIYIYTYIYIYICTYIHTYIHIRTYIHIYSMCIHMYVYIFTHIHVYT